MNDIQIFENSEFGQLEVLTLGEKHYFPATACAEILGYNNPRDAVIRHCKRDGVVKHDGVSKTTNQYGVISEQKSEIKYISEGNLYRLIIRSKLPKAEEFEKWVFDEVLPTIRKHGAYINPVLLEELKNSNQKTNDLLQALTDEISKRENLQKENARLLPKAKYCDLILQNPTAVPVTLIAKDYGFSAMRFNAMLNELGIQYCVGGTWELYQDYAGNGYTHGNVHISRNGHSKMHTCWTQKGRMFLYDYLKRFGIVPAIEKA